MFKREGLYDFYMFIMHDSQAFWVKGNYDVINITVLQIVPHPPPVKILTCIINFHCSGFIADRVHLRYFLTIGMLGEYYITTSVKC